MWILWKMRFWKCEFCENVNFGKMWILGKVRFSKCEFLEKLWIFAPVCALQDQLVISFTRSYDFARYFGVRSFSAKLKLHWWWESYFIQLSGPYQFLGSRGHIGAKILICPKESYFEPSNVHNIHIFRISFSTKFTFSKSRFSQNSHL